MKFLVWRNYLVKKIKPDYDSLREDDVMYAYRKRHPKDVFPVYYFGYDKNWDEQQWTDGEGTTFADNELVFIDAEDYFHPKPKKKKKEPMTDLWLSPYGEVIKCDGAGGWKHAQKAGEILNKRYGCNYFLPYKQIEWTDELEHKGWIRWTSVTGCGWILRPDVKPTTDQLDKIFELTGEIPEDIW